MSKKKATDISLPTSKTQKIMTSAMGCDRVSRDVVALATKATEIFLMDFVRKAYDQSTDEEFRSNVLEYEDIQRLVHRDQTYEFLLDGTPKRMKFRDASRLYEQNKDKFPIVLAPKVKGKGKGRGRGKAKANIDSNATEPTEPTTTNNSSPPNSAPEVDNTPTSEDDLRQMLQI